MPNPSNTSTTSSDGFRRTVLHSVPERRESASRQARQQEEEDAAAAAISNAGSSVQKSELRESNTEMKPKSTADERLGSVEGEKQEITSPRRRPEKISESPGPPPPRRKSSFSYGYRLPDGKLRPPETQEEWNAFYQEYTTGNTVTHSEKFLVSGKAPLNDTMSPLSGSPKMVTEPVLAEEPKVDPAKAADVAYRYSGSNLASAFISPRPSTSRQGGTSSSRLSGDPLFSGGYSRYPPLEHRSSQELQGLTPSTGQSPSDMASPAETPRVSTPGTGRNQDPEIPNIDFAQFSKNRASYQSGMKVSSSRREDELDAEKPQTWGSDAAYQQRDLARLLGQSSAKVMKRIPSHSINHSDAETETDDGAKSAISVATVQQGMADLSGLGGDGAESSKKDVPERPRSTDLEHGSESDDSQSDQVIPAEGGTTQEIPTSQDDAVQIIPYLEPEDRQTTSIPEPESSVLPESEAEAPFSPAYRISHPPTFRATLSELQEEHLGDSPARSHENPASTQPSPKQASHRNFTAPQDRSVRRVDELRHARPRLDSEVSEDPYRIDVSARERAEALRLKEVWEQKGHLTAPKPLPGDARRRAKAIWKLGLDRPGEEIHRSALDRYVRLAKAICESKMAMITILGDDCQICPSKVGADVFESEYDLSFCTHTALSQDKCMTVPDARKDWRFRKLPGIAAGTIRAYCGAPLNMTFGRHTVTIGSLCVADDKPRPDFNEDIELALQDLAACIGGELELLYVHEEQKFQQIMHETSVQFLRDCLQVQHIPDVHRKSKEEPIAVDAHTTVEIKGIVQTDKAKGDKINLYDETCRIIGDTLNATACIIIDTTCFHVFYPTSADKNSSTASITEPTGGSRTTGSRTSSISSRSSRMMAARAQTGRADEKRARNLQYDEIDRHHPQVRFLPGKRRRTDQQAAIDAAHKIPILGRWAESEDVHFDMNIPSAKEALTAFIATNLQGRRYWFERDESEDIADSINAIMPESTSTSLSMPIFDYRGQCSFIFIACWNDLYYSYDQGILAFVETMCGTLMASSLRNRLSAVDEAQRAFARMANHELKTPMHQMSNYIEEMLYLITESKEQREQVPVEVLQELEKYAVGAQTSSRRMRHLLDAVTNYLEIGGEYGEKRAQETDETAMNVDDLLTIAMEDARKRETKNRHLAGDTSMDDVEMIVEIVPRETGTWLLTRDVNPLQDAIHQLILNACQATKTGFISLICEDVSRKDSVPEGYDASLPTSIISIRITDTGSGMSQDFADHRIYQPYIKRDQNTPGAGLGVTLAHRTIDLMGGTLAFQSKLGVGTTAMIEVPLKIKNEDLDSVIHERHFRGVDCKICILGFDEHSNPGVRNAGNSLRNQIKALRVEVGQISDSDIIVIEGQYDIKDRLSEIEHAAQHRTLRIIRLGHSNMYNAADREKTLGGERNLPVEWLFRPVYPRLLRRIAMLPIDDTGKALLRQHDNAHNERDAGSQLRWQQEVEGYNKSIGSGPAQDLDDNELRRMSLMRPHSPSTPNLQSRRPSDELSVKINARDLKVLVAEDDMINRKLLCGKLARMKVQAFQAENGQIAIDVYKRCHPKIVLMDIEMPVKSGFEASQGIRAYEKEANLPPCLIWAVTAKSDDVSEMYGLETCGMDKWFTKPLKLTRLEDLIRDKFDILAETPS